MTDNGRFGDWEPADSFTPDNVPDPRQVAWRLHELRMWLESGGKWLGEWSDLDEEQRAVAVCLGEVLTNHLLTKGRDGSALAVHEARVYLSSLDHPVLRFRREESWLELGVEVQAVALGLIDDIVRWLQMEGTVIA